MTIRLYCITQSSPLSRLIPIICLGLLLTGCGKKTFPKPVSPEPPPQINDLQAQVRSKGVELSWSFPDQQKELAKGSSYTYSVMRAQLKWENRNCPDCPAPNQQEVLRIDPAYPAPALVENNRIVWIDTAVARQHAYRYQISIMDKIGHPLTTSNPVMVKVVVPPSAPKELLAAPEPQGILLQWKATNKDEQGRPLHGELQFIVERQSAKGPWERLSTLGVKGNSFLDSAVAANQVYDYQVIPQLMFEETSILGEPVVIHQVKAPEALPPPPPATVWVIPSKGAMEVHWVESQGRTEGYHVYRREDKEIIRLTASPIQHPPYVDKAVRLNAVYFYAVSAVSLQPEQREGLLSKWVEIRSLLFE